MKAKMRRVVLIYFLSYFKGNLNLSHSRGSHFYKKSYSGVFVYFIPCSFTPIYHDDTLDSHSLGNYQDDKCKVKQPSVECVRLLITYAFYFHKIFHNIA